MRSLAKCVGSQVLVLAVFAAACTDQTPLEPDDDVPTASFASPGVRTFSTTGIPMIDFGPAGCVPRDANNAGVVVGWHIQGGARACVIEQGQTYDLGTFGALSSSAGAVNNRGQIVIRSESSGIHHGWLYLNGATTSIAPIVIGTDINARSQVVGRSAGWLWRGLLWDKGEVTDLGDLGGRKTFPLGVNDPGQVVGYSYRQVGPYHAFLWNNGVMTDLGSMTGGWASEAVDINNRGDIIGRDIDFSKIPVESRAWRYSDGSFTYLGSLGSGYGADHPNDINSKGQIVGDFAQNRAWLWEDGALIDLGHLPGSNGSVASTVDNAGRIMGVSGGNVVAWLP